MDSPTAKTQRLFLALWPDAPCSHAIADLVQQMDWPTGAAVYAPQDWHVTLHFLGSVGADRMPDLASLDVAMSPVTLTLDQLWLWPRGLLVLAASVVPQALSELHARLAQRLKAMGLKTQDGAYRPHLTLARKMGEPRLPDRIPPIQFTADRFALVASTGQAPQRYQCLQWLGARKSGE